MASIVTVMPADDGWRVAAEGAPDHFTLPSGAQAEAAALRLARKLARRGEPATVQVRLRDGSLAARQIAPERADTWRWRLPGAADLPATFQRPMHGDGLA